MHDYKLKEESFQREDDKEFVPDLDKILFDRNLKLVVKMTNHKYTSIPDIFEGKGVSDKYMTEQ